jgi:hypothetical protein
MSPVMMVLACSSKPKLPLIDSTTTRDAGVVDTRPKDTRPASSPDTAAPAPADVAPAPVVDAAPGSDVGGNDAAGDSLASDAGPADGSTGSDSAPVTGDGGVGGPVSGEAKWSYTMCDKKTLMFPKIDKNNGVFPIGSCPPPETLARPCGGNSKLKVTMTAASTWETGYYHPPQYAVDEHLMTRWSSNSGPAAFLTMDLGAEQSFKRIYLAWELAHASDYDLVVSNDGMTWTMLKQVRGGDGFQDIVDVEGKARYLRMNGIKRGEVGEGPYGYSLFDVTICGERP